MKRPVLERYGEGCPICFDIGLCSVSPWYKYFTVDKVSIGVAVHIGREGVLLNE